MKWSLHTIPTNMLLLKLTLFKSSPPVDLMNTYSLFWCFGEIVALIISWSKYSHRCILVTNWPTTHIQKIPIRPNKTTILLGIFSWFLYSVGASWHEACRNWWFITVIWSFTGDAISTSIFVDYPKSVAFVLLTWAFCLCSISLISRMGCLWLVIFPLIHHLNTWQNSYTHSISQIHIPKFKYTYQNSNTITKIQRNIPQFKYICLLDVFDGSFQLFDFFWRCFFSCQNSKTWKMLSVSMKIKEKIWFQIHMQKFIYIWKNSNKHAKTLIYAHAKILIHLDKFRFIRKIQINNKIKHTLKKSILEAIIQILIPN